MKKVIGQNLTQRSVDYLAEKPLATAGKIQETFLDADNVRMYKMTDGKEVVADTYDNIWGQPKGKIRPKNYRDESPDTRSNWH